MQLYIRFLLYLKWMTPTHLKEPGPRLPPHLPLLPADLAQPHRLHVTLPADDGAAHVEAGGRVRQARLDPIV